MHKGHISPVVIFLDEENRSTNFNELVVLNAVDFSFDLDVDPSADQALTFTWFCKKSDEVCLLWANASQKFTNNDVR